MEPSKVMGKRIMGGVRVECGRDWSEPRWKGWGRSIIVGGGVKMRAIIGLFSRRGGM